MELDFLKNNKEAKKINFSRNRKNNLSLIGKNPHQDWLILILVNLILIAVFFVLAYFQMKNYESIIDDPAVNPGAEKIFEINKAKELLREFENKRGL